MWYQNKSDTKGKIKFTLGALIILVFVSLIGMLMLKPSEVDLNSQLQVLSLEEFQDLSSSKSPEDVFVYVGRDSCPTCSIVYPSLCKIKDGHELNMFYYCTEPDRSTRPNEMNAFLDSVGVEYVPMVVVISGGTIQSVVDGELFVSQYLNQ